MAKHRCKINNCNGLLAWTTRPVNKMNNKELEGIGRQAKKFIKRYSSKKRRVYLKTIE